MSKLVCFDFDGTLCDSWPPFEVAALRYTAEYKLPPLCTETLKTGYGYPDEHDFWPGLSREEQKEHLYKLYRIVDDPRHDMMGGIFPVLFDGVLDTLEHLKSKDYTLAIVTARPKDPLQVILDHHQMKDYFCGYRTHDDGALRGEKGKPYPDQLLSVIRELNYSPDRTIMIGDTCMDMRMGKAAAVTSIGVCWGNHCEARLSEAGADHIIANDFKSIAALVDSI